MADATTPETTRDDQVLRHIEKTYKHGELFRVSRIADELGLWNEHGCAPAEWAIRRLVERGKLAHFVDVERREAPGRVDYVRYSRMP